MKVKFTEDGNEKVIDLEDEDFVESHHIKIEKDSNDHKRHHIKGKIIAVTPLLCITAYLTIGFVLNIWSPSWVIFFLIPLVPMILNIFNKKKREAVMAFISIATVVGYLCIGLFAHIWHPSWLIFFLIPIFSILLSRD